MSENKLPKYVNSSSTYDSHLSEPLLKIAYGPDTMFPLLGMSRRIQSVEEFK
jgi:hypothetical protein